MNRFYLREIFSLERLKNFLIIVLFVIVGVVIGKKIVQIPKREEIVFFILLISFIPLLKYYQTGIPFLFIIPVFIPLIRRVYYLAYARPEIDLIILIPDLILVLTLVGYLLAFKGKKESNEYVRKVKKVLLFYVIFLFLRVFFFNESSISRSFLAFKFYGPFVLSFFLGAAATYNIRMLKGVGIITIILGIFTAIYGINQLHFGFNTAEKMWLSSIAFQSLFIKGVARPFSTLTSPANFADFQQLTIIALTALFYFTKKRYLQILILGLMSLCMYSILITSVRSSWIGIVVSILVWFVLLRKPGIKARVSGIMVILVIFAVGTFLGDYLKPTVDTTSINTQMNKNVMDLLVKDRLSAVTNPLEEHSMTSRLTLWTFVIESSIEFPLLAVFGRGLNNLAADSVYFTYIAEFGYPGLILFLYIMWILIKGGINVFDNLKNPELKIFAKAIMTMNIVFMTINITGIHINDFPGYLYFWFFNGVLLKLKDVEEFYNVNDNEIIET